MQAKCHTDNKRESAIVYCIRVRGELNAGWTEWFDGMCICPEAGDTLLIGPVADQAALHGLLRRVRDLGLPLISVYTVDDA